MNSNVQHMTELKVTYKHDVLLWLTLLILVSVAWRWFSVTPAPASQPNLVIGDVRIGESRLCPGDALVYTYTVNIMRPGVYVFDSTVWRDHEPQQVVVWADQLRFVASVERHVTLARHWRVPETVYDALRDEITPIAPGRYTRAIAVTAFSRNTLPSIATIPFEVLPDCGDKQ